ncbi:MAG: hypothetical protein LUE14_04020 [Clostridiales bacterium]|nr:hypothetical protein [Clostridiales bacterium]
MEKRNIFRMTYYLPDQSRVFSEPLVFDTEDIRELQAAIRTAGEKGYEVIWIDFIPNPDKPE